MSAGFGVEFPKEGLVANVILGSELFVKTVSHNLDDETRKHIEEIPRLQRQTLSPELDEIIEEGMDAAHRLTRVDYPDNRHNEYTYDGNGFLLEMKNNDGTKAVFSRNARGEIMSITDEENRTVTFVRDVMGRVTSETSPTGRSVSYEWNSPGCQSCGEDVVLTKIIDSGNKEWEFKYDIMGNATEMIYPDGTKIIQEYDTAGRLVEFTNKRGQEIGYHYDSDGRLDRKTLPEGEITFTYDDRDRVTRINGGAYDYVYQYGLGDELMFEGPVVKETNQVTGAWQVSVIDHMGAPRRIVDSFGWQRDYEYGWQTGQAPFGAPPSRITLKKSGQYSEQRFDYAYDQQFRITDKDAYQMKSTDYTYDSNGVLDKIQYGFADVWFPPVQGELDFTRDHSGLITGVTGDRFFTVTYNNDLEIESVQHTAPQAFTEQYTYDTRGNRLTSPTASYTYDDLNRLTESATHLYTYDADGNTTEVVNKATTETRKYYYNSENRLTGYEHYPTDTDPADVTAAYTYDIYGRRLSKTVDGLVTNFFWHGNNISMELDGGYQPIRKYIYNAGMDDVEGHLEYSEVVHWDNVFSWYEGWYYYAKDHVGTVYKVADMRNEQLAEERTYDVFGNLSARTGSSGCNFGFQGKYYDNESGLYYFYNRYYNPATGRFINEDPIGVNGGLNLYGFVFNNPLYLIDPFGLDALTDKPRVRIRMCCIWDQVKRFKDDSVRYERSFTVYRNQSNPAVLMFEYGSRTDEENRTTTEINIYQGFNVIAWFHTHPNNLPPTPGGDDITLIARPFGIPVYALSEEKVVKVENGIASSVMAMPALANWCLTNMQLWKNCCGR